MGLSSTTSTSSNGFLPSAASRPYHKSKPTLAKKMKRNTTSTTSTTTTTNNNNQKIRFHSTLCVDVSEQELVFNRFDFTVPHQAHKMQQRQKAIAKGKNTVGYDEYCRRVPKDQRQKRSMETPSTPDPTLDIPNKKWNGMVKAWYD
jgi:Histone RNA hairpin-binding protein RNA-binding domain